MDLYAFESQCKMLAELGYEGITVSALSGQPLTDPSLLPTVKARHGLDIAALYTVLHKGRNDALLRRIYETVEGVHLIRPSERQWRRCDQAQHSVAAGDRRAPRDADRALSPPRHVTHTTQQVVDPCRYIDHPQLGASFNGYHWYAGQEGQLEQRLAAMKPWLMQVVLSGNELSPWGWGGVATMEPPDRDELDNFAIVGALDRLGSIGIIGILGWDYSGDVYSKLGRSLAAMYAIDARLARRSQWAGATT